MLQQLRDRIGRTSTQYIDVERTATTPERFSARRAPLPLRSPPRATRRRLARAPPSTRRSTFSVAPAAAGSEPATFLLDEFLELRTFESFPGLRRSLHELVDGLAAQRQPIRPDQPLHGAGAPACCAIDRRGSK